MKLISFQQPFTSAHRKQAGEAAVASYRSALASLSRHTPELSPERTATYRHRLAKLASELGPTPTPDLLAANAAALDQELQKWNGFVTTYQQHRDYEHRHLLALAGQALTLVAGGHIWNTEQLQEIAEQLQMLGPASDLDQVSDQVAQQVEALRASAPSHRTVTLLRERSAS